MDANIDNQKKKNKPESSISNRKQRVMKLNLVCTYILLLKLHYFLVPRSSFYGFLLENATDKLNNRERNEGTFFRTRIFIGRRCLRFWNSFRPAKFCFPLSLFLSLRIVFNNDNFPVCLCF